MNQELLRNFISEYEKEFAKISGEESYKWRAVKQFQDNWKTDADNFVEMLTLSLSKTENLMDSGYYYPRKMIIAIAEKESRSVRRIFIDLFDEGVVLLERIELFQKEIKGLNDRLFPGKNHYQDDRAVLVYLTLRYPEIYYFYKFGMYKVFCEKMEDDFKPTMGRKSNTIEFLKMCEEVKREIRSNNKLLTLHKERITESEYFDTGSNILTQDFIYAVTKYLHLQTDMENTRPDWRWEEGGVDEQEEHIELRYGNANQTSYEDWTPIARLAPPKDHVFIVEWLVQQESTEHADMLADARRSLDINLVEERVLEPWDYALYQCNTSSNMYSMIHWSYFPNGHEGKRHASKVIQLSAEEAVKLLGDAGKPGKYIEQG